MKKQVLFFTMLLLIGSVMAQLQSSQSISEFQSPNPNKDVALYDQLGSAQSTMASQEFPDFGDSRLQVADDFIVPSGGWDLIRVDVLGQGIIPPQPDGSFIVEIYTDNGGLPSVAPLFMQDNLAVTENAGLYSITLSSQIHLDPGTYWICVMADMSFGTYGQWFWGNYQGTQINQKFALQDPDLLLGGGYPQTWDYGDFTWAGWTAYNACFALYGPDAPPAVPIGNWALVLAGILIVVFVVFRNKIF